jgi:polysaccharide biosynthesis transport protein
MNHSNQKIGEKPVAGKENEFSDYVRVIWKWKYFIFLGTLVSTIIAIIISLSLSKVYQATVTFLITTSPVVLGPGGEQPESRYDLLTETYKGIIINKSTLLSTLEKFNLNKNPQGLTLENLGKLISVKSVPNSKLLRLNVELPNPQLAADIANFVAENAVSLNVKLSQGDTIEAQKFYNEEVKKIQQEFQEAEKEYLDFQKQARMADLRKLTDNLLQQKSSLSLQLTDTEINLKGEESKEKRLEEEIKSRGPKITLSRSVADDPSFQQLLSSLSSTQQKDFMLMKTNSEAINEAYGIMDQDLVSSRAHVDMFKSRKEATIDSLAKINQELKTVQVTLAKQGMEETKLNNRYLLASSVYQDFRRKLEEAKINVFSTSQELKILDPAIIPSEPVKPNKRVVVVFTFICAGMVFLFLAFLLEYLHRMKMEDRLPLPSD